MILYIQEYRKRSKDDPEVAEQNEMYAKEIRKATASKSLPALYSVGINILY